MAKVERQDHSGQEPLLPFADAETGQVETGEKKGDLVETETTPNGIVFKNLEESDCQQCNGQGCYACRKKSGSNKRSA
ncbi:MAG TPA: hypothetical protein VJB98_01380 [Candidatus Paceibacterota bacterium]